MIAWRSKLQLQSEYVCLYVCVQYNYMQYSVDCKFYKGSVSHRRSEQLSEIHAGQTWEAVEDNYRERVDGGDCADY